MKKNDAKKPRPAAGGKRPANKEDALREMIEKDPEKAAQMIREILKGK